MTVVVGKMSEPEQEQVMKYKIGPNLSQEQRAQFTNFVRASTIVWQASRDDRCLCIWGLMPPTLSSNTAYMWFYIVEYIEQLEFLIVRHSRRAIEKALEEYPIIVGHCQRDNERAIRWMKWLGATFADYDFDLLPFRIERKDG